MERLDMEVIVTGATSFIGLAVTEQLLAAGNCVWAVVRRGSANLEKLKPHPLLKIIELNMNEITELPEILEKNSSSICAENGKTSQRAFLHMAWDGVGSTGRSDVGIQKQNMEHSLTAVRVAAAAGCSRFLFSGSQAEYGICRDIMTEMMPCNPVSEYGKAKLAFGLQAAALSRELGLHYIHTRIFSVYGPGDHPWSLVSSCLKTWKNGGHMQLGECTQKWNFIYLDDAAAAIMKLLTTGKPGIYNIAGSETRVLREFVEEMYQLCGEKGSYSYGQRPDHAEGPASLIPDIGAFIKAVGWQPEISFKEGISRMLRQDAELG